MKCSLLQQALLSTMVNEMLCQTRLETGGTSNLLSTSQHLTTMLNSPLDSNIKKHVVSDNLFQVTNNIFD